MEWDDNNSHATIPEYNILEDQFCQGYIGMLKKNKKYKAYLNQVSQPGGLRPIRNKIKNEKREQSLNMRMDYNSRTTFA